jgi:hypothetical protein
VVVKEISKRNVHMVIERTGALRREGVAESHNIKSVRMESIEKLDARSVAGNMFALSMDATL